EATWAVLIVTPIMERAQKLECSQEIIFIDSTSSVDVTTGAIPLAILIHNGESKESYTNAFNLLQNNFPFCFGGNSSPMIFMSDDSRAEKNSLHSVWASAKQFLCHFHMAQAEWRNHETNNNAEASIRVIKDILLNRTKA
ncbi:SWIM-type domain-containing protein, partial [Aphis craccivora]